MRIEELRIGNYVEYNGCTGVVYAVHSPMPCEDEHFRDIGIVELVIGGIVTARIDEIKSIPLTEELLLKFGFEYQKRNNSYQLDSNLGFTIWGRVYSGFNVFVDDVEFGGTIHYIHQLQNLYHSLTGQELEIKK